MLLKITQNTIFQLLSRFSSVLLTVILSSIIVRSFGVQVWDKYAIAINYLSFFYLLVDLGFNTSQVQDYSLDESYAKEKYSSFMAIKLFFGVFAGVLAGSIAYFLPYSPEIKKAIFIGIPLIILFSLVLGLNLYYQVFAKYSAQFIATFLGSLSSILFLFFIISRATSISTAEIIKINLLGALVTVVVSFWFARDSLNFKRYDKEYGKKLAFGYLLLSLTMILNSVMFNVDKILLSFWGDNLSVGTYTIAYKLFEIFLVFPAYMMNAFVPHLSRVRKADLGGFKESLKKIIYLSSACWVIGGFLLLIFAKYLIPVIWGEELNTVYQPLLLLVLTALPFFITAPLNWYFVLEKQFKYLLVSYSVGGAFNLLANYLTIPTWGYNAAAINTGLTELVVLFVFLYYLRKN